MTWSQAALALAVALIGVAGRDLFTALFRRRRNRIDEAQVLTGVAVGLVEPLRVELDTVRKEAHAIAADLRKLRRAIMAPDANIDGLRVLVQGQTMPPEL